MFGSPAESPWRSMEKTEIPKFQSEAEEAEWWDQHREETEQWVQGDHRREDRDATLVSANQLKQIHTQSPTLRSRDN